MATIVGITGQNREEILRKIGYERPKLPMSISVIERTENGGMDRFHILRMGGDVPGKPAEYLYTEHEFRMSERDNTRVRPIYPRDFIEQFRCDCIMP